MTCRKRNLLIIYWYLKIFPQYFVTRILCQTTYADLRGVRLFEVGDVSVMSPTYLNVYEKDSVRYILASSSKSTTSSVFALDSKVKQHKNCSVLGSGFTIPYDVLKVPDGIFDFPALVIPDGFPQVKSMGSLTIVDVTNFSNPQFHVITNDTPTGPLYCYFNPVWLNDKEFIVSRRYDKEEFEDYMHELMLYKRKDSTTAPWRETKYQVVNATAIVLHKNVWNGFDVFYAISGFDESLYIFWVENEDKQPGDWSRDRNVKTEPLDIDFSTLDMKLVDLNDDGKIDLLVSRTDYEEKEDGGKRIFGEIAVYEIPQSEGFKDASAYTVYTLIDFEADTCKPDVVRTFMPSTSHKGKPWIVVAGGEFGTAYYIVPFTNDTESWNYKRFRFHSGSNSVTGVEATDIDGDGFTELFISLLEPNIVKIFSFRSLNELVTHPVTLVSVTDVLLGNPSTISCSFHLWNHFKISLFVFVVLFTLA